jgi:hypothetical protein
VPGFMRRDGASVPYRMLDLKERARMAEREWGRLAARTRGTGGRNQKENFLGQSN